MTLLHLGRRSLVPSLKVNEGKENPREVRGRVPRPGGKDRSLARPARDHIGSIPVGHRSAVQTIFSNETAAVSNSRGWQAQRKTTGA